MMNISYEKPNASRPNRGFTLLELLIVIAIIAGLMSIMLPQLHKVRLAAKDTQCLSNLKSLMVANTIYIGEEGKFSPLNNQEDDGTWQYNYLIYDGSGFETNFGPLVDATGIISFAEQLYCPRQQNESHMYDTQLNPWPVLPGLDTRAAYGRRYHLTGKTLSQIPHTIAFAADLLHLPKMIDSGHKTGVNAVYTDGHGQWVRDPGILTDNELSHPFDPLDNPIMRDIWRMLDDAG